MLPGSHGPAPCLPELPPQAQLPRLQSAGEETVSARFGLQGRWGAAVYISCLSVVLTPLLVPASRMGEGLRLGKEY